jgi:hypothetical protein
MKTLRAPSKTVHRGSPALLCIVALIAMAVTGCSRQAPRPRRPFQRSRRQRRASHPLLSLKVTLARQQLRSLRRLQALNRLRSLSPSLCLRLLPRRPNRGSPD